VADHGLTARIGIDLGGTKIAGALLDSVGGVYEQQRVATPRDDYAGTLAAIVELVNALDPGASASVGIGTPGSMIPGTGRMHNCNSVWLNGQPLLADLTGQLGERVRIANDADCFALSEANGGSGVGVRSVFGVILGTGVGGGIVLDGALLVGAGGLAGEWGHNLLPELPGEASAQLNTLLRSRQCYCGQLNCVETFLSGPGMARSHEQLWGVRMTAEAVYRQALNGRAVWEPDLGAADLNAAVPAAQAQTTLSVYCRMLVVGLAQIVNVFDPEVIVLGGGLSKMQEIYHPVQTALARQVFGGRGVTRLRPPAFGDAGGVRGAAWLWDQPLAMQRDIEKDN
jgi:fructokinase